MWQIIAGVTLLAVLFGAASAFMAQSIGWRMVAGVWAGAIAFTALATFAIYLLSSGAGWETW